MPADTFLAPPAGPTGAISYLVILSVLVVVPVMIGLDASRRNGSGLPWALVTFFLDPIGWVLYAIFRPGKRVRPIE